MTWRTVEFHPQQSAGGQSETAKADRTGDSLARYLRDLRQITRSDAEAPEALDLKERMICANLRLVISVARRYQGQGVPLLDLIQEGNLGLLRAVDKFDPMRGCRLSTYAVPWIRQAIVRAIFGQAGSFRLPLRTSPAMRAVRRDTSSLDSPVAVDAHVTLGEILEDATATHPAEAIGREQLQARVRSALHTLPPRERAVIHLRFGLRDGRCRTLAEVALHLAVTEEQVRQIEAHALRLMRGSLTRSQGLE